MATEIRFGIVIGAKDLATKVVQGAKTGVTGALKSISETAAKARASMGSIFSNLANIKAGFDIIGKGAKMAVQGLSALIATTLESRAAGDKQRRDWERYMSVFKEIASLVGGPLLSAFLGLMDVFKPLIEATRSWLKENQKVLGQGMLEFLLSMARLLTSGVATAVITVSRVWAGWNEIVGVVKIAVNSMFAGILSGAAAVVGGIESLARRFGREGLAKSAEEARLAVEALGTEFSDSADRALGETAQVVANQDALEAKVRGVAETIERLIGGRAVIAYKRLDEAVYSAKSEEAYQKRMAAEALAFDANMMRSKLAADLAEQNLARQVEISNTAYEYQKTKAEELASKVTAVYSAIRSVAVSAFADIGKQADGSTKTIGDAFGQLFGGLAEMALNAALEFAVGEGIKRAAMALTAKEAVAANAATAASGAAASQAGIPIIGPVLAIAAMGAMLGTVLALAGGFEGGGILPGAPSSL